jgi:prolyl-tRNA synthetase
VLFADMDLIGIPHRVVLSERGLAAGNAEYKGRRDEKPQEMPLDSISGFLKERLRA